MYYTSLIMYYASSMLNNLWMTREGQDTWHSRLSPYSQPKLYNEDCYEVGVPPRVASILYIYVYTHMCVCVYMCTYMSQTWSWDSRYSKMTPGMIPLIPPPSILRIVMRFPVFGGRFLTRFVVETLLVIRIRKIYINSKLDGFCRNFSRN